MTEIWDPTYAEARAAVMDAADVLDHPYKGVVMKRRGRVGPARYGSPRGGVVYGPDGHVGISVGDTYLIARGPTHEASVRALAHYLDLSVRRRKEDLKVRFPDNHVRVDEVDAGWFWLFCNPEGKLSAEK